MLFLGVSSNVAAGVIIDTTGVPIATNTCAAFYKTAGSLNLGFITSNATAQTKNAALVAMVSGQTYQAGFHWDPGDGTTSYVTPWVYDETSGLRLRRRQAQRGPGVAGGHVNPARSQERRRGGNPQGRLRAHLPETLRGIDMYPTDIDPIEMHEVANDFFNLDVVRFATVDDGGTGSQHGRRRGGGQVSFVTAASDNDYHWDCQAAATWLLAAKKPIWFVCRFTHVEANTDDQNFYIGLSSIIDGTLMGADGAGPVADGTLFGFYKVDGDLKLGVITSNSTTQTKTAQLTLLVSGQSYQVGFYADPNDGTTALVTPWVYDETANVRTVGDPHKVALAALAQANIIYGPKAGGANAETLSLDYIRCARSASCVVVASGFGSGSGSGGWRVVG